MQQGTEEIDEAKKVAYDDAFKDKASAAGQRYKVSLTFHRNKAQ